MSRTERRVVENHKASDPLQAGTGLQQVCGLALLLGAAALFRISYLVQSTGLPYFSIPLVDAEYYNRWAERVAAGQGYGPSPFYLAPLYPYWLAMFKVAFGADMLPVYMVQIVLGVANLAMVYVLARRLFGHAAGLIAILLLALYAPVLILETKLLSETLGLTLTLAALLLLLRLIERPSGWLAGLAGLVLGLSVLCRSSNLLFAILLLAWLGWRAWRSERRQGLRTAAALAGGLALAILPVTIRNYVVGNDLVLIQTNLGMTFAQGNNETSVGVLSHPPGTGAGIASQQAEEMHIASQELDRPVKPSESSAYWLKRSLGWIRDNPGAYLGLLGRKLVYAVNNREELDSYETYYEIQNVPILRAALVPFSVLFGLALLGIMDGRGRPGVRLLVIYAASVLITLAIFYVSSRYRVPAVPVLAVLAGQGVLVAWRQIRERKVAALAGSAVLLAAVTVIAQVTYPMKKSDGAFVLKEVAGHYLTKGKPDEAAKMLQEAVRISPQSAPLRAELGRILERSGRVPEAIQEYQLALQEWPDNAELHVSLAGAFERLGHRGQADEHWEAALRLAPNSDKVHVNRAAALFARGDRAAAVEHFREAVRLQPGSVLAHGNLGFALVQTGQLDEGLKHLGEALRLDPKYVPARGNLCRALAESGSTADAIALLAEGVRLRPEVPAFRYDLARLLAGAGRVDEAIAAYRGLLEVDPRNLRARQELERLQAGRPPRN